MNWHLEFSAVNTTRLLLTTIIACLLSVAHGYQPPVNGPVTVTWVGDDYVNFSIVDPITGQTRSGSSPIISNGLKSYVGNVSNGIVHYHAKYDGGLQSDSNMIGFSVYDPALGEWRSHNSHYGSATLSYSIEAGIVAWVVKDQGYYSVHMATYEPDSHQWIKSTSFPTPASIALDIDGSSGIVSWSYVSTPGQYNKIEFAIYDPTRKEWKFGSSLQPLPAWQAFYNGAVLFNSTWDANDRAGYDYHSGSWKTWITHSQTAEPTKPIPSFRVQTSYGGASNVRWVTDMSVGQSRSLNWGDGTSSGGSGYHVYTATDQRLITLDVTGWTGTVATTGTIINEASPSSSSVLAALSARGHAGSGENTMIGGLVLGGSGSKSILMNARGPSLTQFGIPNPITNPSIYLYNSSGLMAMNDDWGNATNSAQIAATGGAPGHSNEAAILSALTPGAYTALIGNSGSGEIGIFEAFDITGGSSIRLTGLATRAFVGTGNSVLISGLVISGGAKQVLINGKGPSLSSHGVTNALSNPRIHLVDANGVTIASNDDWQNAWNASAINSVSLKPSHGDEACIYQVLPAGTYMIILEGTSSTTGVGLLEVFEM